MFREIRFWLGPTRIRILVALLIATGISSFAIRAAYPDESWSLGVQTLLVLAFLGGALLVVGSKLPPFVRRRLAFRVIPAMVAVLLGIVFADLLRLFLGAALGWLIVGQILLRDTEKREYKDAIRAMRGGRYERAIEIMGQLIKKEPQDPAHYSFRAQLHRLNDDPRKARSDYKKVMELDPESGVGQNGLAEVSLQEGSLGEARKWAETAYQKAPGDWVALYNLGMIAERQKDDSAAQDYLEKALQQGLPDARHRLLAKTWLVKVYYRQEDRRKASEMATQLGREKAGLNEWKIVLKSDEAKNIRQLLAADVLIAEKLLDGQLVGDVLDG